MAVAGFGQDDLEITVRDNQLIVAGKVKDDAAGELLYRGIAGRAFERRFALADHIVVDGADLRNGLLHVALKRVVPEALKPRRIAIGGAQPAGQPTIANDSEAPPGGRLAATRLRGGPGNRPPLVASEEPVRAQPRMTLACARWPPRTLAISARSSAM